MKRHGGLEAFRCPRDRIGSAAEFGGALSELRRGAGLTVRELSAISQVPRSTLQDYLSGRHLPPAHRPEDLGPVLDALGVPAELHEEWFECVRQLADRRPVGGAARRPWPGLDPFDPDDADVFFGRAGHVAALVDLVGRGAGQATTVVGVSGVGKSSLLRAGLVPSMRDDGWQARVVTPGSDVGKTLDEAITSLDGAGKALLIIDQVEQLWTLGGTPGVRDEVWQRLSAFAGDPARRVVLGLRLDFMSHALQVPWLLSSLQDHQFLVGPMTDDELAQAVRGPAEEFRLALGPGLLEQLLEDAGALERDAVLPHLSHTLAQMWQNSKRRVLTVADYRGVGGLSGSVARSAETAWATLPEAHRDQAKRVLLRLVVIEEDLPPAGGVLLLDDVTEPQNREVIDHFAQCRLLSVGEQAVRFSHEAVLSAWDRMREWIAEDRDRLRSRRVLAREAREWDSSGRDCAYLMRGSRLAAAQEHSPDELSDVENAFVTACTEEQDRSAARQRKELRRTRGLLVAISVLAVVALFSAALVVNSKMLIAAERDQARSRQIAAEARDYVNRDPGVSRQLAVASYATADTLQSRSAVLTAASVPRTTSVNGPTGARFVTAAPGKELLAVTGVEPVIRIYSTRSAVLEPLSEIAFQLPPGPGEAVYSVTFSRDGRLLAAAGSNGVLRLFDVSLPQRPTQVGADIRIAADADGQDTVYQMAFGQANRLSVATPAEGVRRFEVSAGAVGELPALKAAGYLSAVDELDDGTVAVGNQTGQLSLFDPNSPAAPVSQIPAGQGYISAIAHHGSDLYVAQRRENRAVKIAVNRGVLQPPVVLAEFDSWVNSVQVSQADDLVVFGSSDRTVKVLSTTGGQVDQFSVAEAVSSVALVNGPRVACGVVNGQTVLRDLRRPAVDASRTPIFITAWSADGRRLVSFPAGTANEVRVWDSTDPLRLRPLATLRDNTGPAVVNGTGDIRGDGNLVVAATSTGALVGWDLSDLERPRLVLNQQVSSKRLEQATFVDDSHVLVAAADNNAYLVQLDGAEAKVVQSYRGATDSLYNAQATSTLVATSGADGNTRLYRRDSGELLSTIPGDGLMYSASFRRDATQLATAGAGRTVRVYDISDPRSPRTTAELHGPISTVYLLDFAPDGRLAAATLEGGAMIWEPDGDQFSLLANLSAGASLFGVRFSPDGRYLAGQGQRGALHIWMTRPAEARNRVCATAGDGISREQWAAILPDLPYRRPC